MAAIGGMLTVVYGCRNYYYRNRVATSSGNDAICRDKAPTAIDLRQVLNCRLKRGRHRVLAQYLQGNCGENEAARIKLINFHPKDYRRGTRAE